MATEHAASQPQEGVFGKLEALAQSDEAGSQPQNESIGASEYGQGTEGQDVPQEIHYRLEISQNPTRGRTCGFGDADRRALSAPLIVRLRAYNLQSDQEVSADSLNINFMVCAADLWSADTTEEMNLVQHSGFQYKAGVGVGTSPVPSPALAPDSPPSRHPESTLQSDSTDAAIGSDVFQALLPRPSLRNPWEGPSVSGRPRTSPVEPITSPETPTEQPSQASSTPHAPTLPPILPAWAAAPFSQANDDHHPDYRIRSSGGGMFSQTSPTTNTFAFSAPGQAVLASAMDAVSNLPPRSPDMSAYPWSRRTSSRASISTLPPRTGSSSGPRPFTSYTARPSTSATTVSMSTSGSRGGTFSMLVPASHPSDFACVKNLVGAMTACGYRLKPPGETEAGVFFVYPDLR
ncbi:hypothetical protein EMMF5_000976 [Cystobasidiomycetes sp. EMM_F5]